MSASSLARALNAAGLLGCSLILLVAFWFQIVLGELPCPLCVLQRAAFTAVGLGLVLNICDRPRPSHYAIVILSAVVGGAVSARQTALHIIPGTGTYGSDLFGFHFYVWALIAFTGIIVAVAILCLWDRQFTPEAAVSRSETVSVLGAAHRNGADGSPRHPGRGARSFRGPAVPRRGAGQCRLDLRRMRIRPVSRQSGKLRDVRAADRAVIQAGTIRPSDTETMSARPSSSANSAGSAPVIQTCPCRAAKASNRPARRRGSR